MRKIIDGEVFDTKEAEFLFKIEDSSGWDYNEYFKTKNNKFFLVQYYFRTKDYFFKKGERGDLRSKDIFKTDLSKLINRIYDLDIHVEKGRELEQYLKPTKNEEEEAMSSDYEEVVRLRKKVAEQEKELQDLKDKMNKVKSKAKEELQWILSDND